MRTALWCLLFCTTSLMAFQAPKVVNISFSGGTISVSPSTVTLNTGGKVRWVSSGNRRDRIEIVFDSQSGKRGPFPSDNSSGNPSRGRYNKNVGSPILTTGASDKGSWKYNVIWTQENGSRHVLDPIVVIR